MNLNSNSINVVSVGQGTNGGGGWEERNLTLRMVRLGSKKNIGLPYVCGVSVGFFTGAERRLCSDNGIVLRESRSCGIRERGIMDYILLHILVETRNIQFRNYSLL